MLYDAVSAVLDKGSSFEAAIRNHEAVAAAAAKLDISDLVDPKRYVAEVTDWVHEEAEDLLSGAPEGDGARR